MAFPYKILNDMSAKLKAAEAEIARLETDRHQNQVNPVFSYDEYYQTLTPVIVNRSNQTRPVSVLHQGVQTESADFVVQSEVVRLMKMVTDLTYENNRYHYKLSNCTCCLSDDAYHDVSPASLDESIQASTSLEFSLPSSTQPSLPSSVPAPGLMLSTTQDKKSSRDKAHIFRMVQCLTKLEKKYQTPPHKRKERIFRRKTKNRSNVPKEFRSIYLSLAAPESEIKSPELDPPKVDWPNVKFRPPLPNPVECTVYGCSVNPKTYQNDGSTPWSAPFYRTNPFGTLLGYRTTEGVIAVPKVPIGGYVYCTEVRQWILAASPPASLGRGTRKGEGKTLLTKRRKG